jgi:hypothetical protein
MTEIVLEKIIQFSHLLPNDIEESTVVHARLGDVVAGNEWFEKIKRPFDIDYVKSLIPINQKTYVIGKCDVFGKWSSFQNRNESTQQSNNYLEKLLSVCDAHHFNSGDPDIDLCCAVKSKTFIQGRGNYSYIIVEIRKKLNLETIETEIDTTTTTK